MKRASKRLSRLAILVTLLSIDSRAQTDTAEKDIAATQHRISVGLNLYRFDYAEELNPPLKSTEKGLLPGARLEYEFTPPQSSFFGGACADYSPASTNFDGTTQTGAPVVSKTANRFLSIEALGGYAPHPWVRPYAGIGYRFWERGDGGVDQQGVVSFREHYSWLFAPVGIRLGGDFGEQWNLIVDASVRFMFAGRITAYLSDINPALNEPSSSLGSRAGYRVRLPLTYRFSPEVGVSVAPWYEYSAIGRGETFAILQSGQTVGTGFEPASRTHQYGVALSLVVYLE